MSSHKCTSRSTQVVESSYRLVSILEGAKKEIEKPKLG